MSLQEQEAPLPGPRGLARDAAQEDVEAPDLTDPKQRTRPTDALDLTDPHDPEDLSKAYAKGARMILQEFREFVNKGNALDLAVGVVIGAAFGRIVDSVVNDLMMPVLGALTGGVDFSARFIVLSRSAGAFETLALARASGAPVLAYGSFVNTVVQFLLIAFSVFIVMRQINRMRAPVVAAK